MLFGPSCQGKLYNCILYNFTLVAQTTIEVGWCMGRSMTVKKIVNYLLTVIFYVTYTIDYRQVPTLTIKLRLDTLHKF